MNRTLTLILALGLAFPSFSQDKSGFISLQSGASIPVGKYHKKELPEGSFTTTGMNLALEGAWFFKPWLGIGGQFGMASHPVDVRVLGYEKVMDDPFMDDVFIRSEPYRNYTLYCGMFFQKPLVQRLSITAKALGGIMFAKTPYQLYKADYYLVGENWFEITSSGDLEGSFLAGAGLKYSLENCIGFTLNGEYTYQQADFDFETSDGTIRTDQKVITYVNVAIGIFLKL